jgi:hypothetical protein
VVLKWEHIMKSRKLFRFSLTSLSLSLLELHISHISIIRSPFPTTQMAISVEFWEEFAACSPPQIAASMILIAVLR